MLVNEDQAPELLLRGDIRAVPTILCAKTELFAPNEGIKEANESFGLTVLLVLFGVIAAVLLAVYSFSDKRRVKPLPEKLDLPPTPIKQD